MIDDVTYEDEMYKENILDHYKHPHNKGKLESYTNTHRELNPLCGDELTIYVQIDNNIVIDVSFDGHGCAISQASASLLTDEIKGKTVDEIKQMSKDDVLELLGIKVGVVRLKCALLSLKVIQKSLGE